MRKAEFAEGTYPRKADDSQILTYFRDIHLGSRADFKRVPYDTEYELREIAVADIPSAVALDNTTANRYAKLETPFPPLIMKSEPGTNPLDGNHRTTAARIRGDKTIRAYVPLAKAEEKLCMACKDPLDKDGHCKVKAHWEELDKMKKDEMEKAKLPMPNANAHHDVVLPAGSVVDQKQKVTHQDGSTSWKAMAAGQIRSMDPSGHPTSSRSPNSK